MAEAHADFLGDLGCEAIRLARKDSLSTVDPVHVEQGVSRLGMRSGQSRSGSAFSTVGGLVAGAGLAGGYTLAFTPGIHSTAQQVTTVILGFIGAFLLAIGLTLTMVSK